MLVVLLFTFAVVVTALDERPIWGDEQYSIYFSGGEPYEPLTPVQVWQRVASEDPVMPPGYTILLNVWIGAVGSDPIVLRLISSFAAVLTLAVTWRLASGVFSSRTALLAVLVLCTSVLFVFYAREMRVYMVLAFATTLMIWLYWRAAYGQRFTAVTVAAFALSAGGLFYLHYFGVFPIAAVALYHLLFVPKNRRWWQVMLAFVLAGVATLPWLSVLVAGIAKFGGEVDVQRRALATGPLLQAVGWLLSNGLPVLLVIALLTVARRRNRGVRALWFLCLVPLAGMVVMNGVLHNIPPSRIRYFLFLWPLFSVLIGHGLDILADWRPATRHWAWVLAGVFLVSGLVNGENPALIAELGGVRQIYPFHEILPVLRSEGQRDDLLVNYWPSARVDLNNRVWEYYSAQWPATSVIVKTNPQSSRWEQQSDVLPELLQNRERLWIAYMPPYAPAQQESFDRMQVRLQSDYNLCQVSRQSDHLSLTLYTRHSICCAATASGNTLVNYGDDVIRLTGIERIEAQNTDVLSLLVGWSLGPDAPWQMYSASIQLMNAAGEKVAQQDEGFQPHAYRCQPVTLDISELPPGTYTLQAAVYEWQTGERLMGVSADGQTGNLLPIDTVTLP